MFCGASSDTVCRVCSSRGGVLPLDQVAFLLFGEKAGQKHTHNTCVTSTAPWNSAHFRIQHLISRSYLSLIDVHKEGNWILEPLHGKFFTTF